MNSHRIDKMIKGWFVGDFTPTAFRTNSCEVALKVYKKGEAEECHYHKVATELTLVVSGRIEMCGKEWEEGDIVVLKPGQETSFKALTDTVNVVVKVPGAKNDKYLTQND